MNGRTAINATLEPDSKALEEVVVVGYGVQEKKMLATSIATISAKQVELIPVASPSEALVGLVAGAQITSPRASRARAPLSAFAAWARFRPATTRSTWWTATRSTTPTATSKLRPPTFRASRF